MWRAERKAKVPATVPVLTGKLYIRDGRKRGGEHMQPFKHGEHSRIRNARRTAKSGFPEVKASRPGEEKEDRIQRLILQLKDNNAMVCCRAAEALGSLRDPRAVKPLIKALLNCEHRLVRKAAAEALGNLKNMRAMPPLKWAARSDPAEDVRRAAKEASEAIKVMDQLKGITARRL